MKKTIVNVIAVIAFSLLFTGCSDVSKVKYSRWNGSDITLSSALEKFFESSEWRSYKANEGRTIVEFQGHNKFVTLKELEKRTMIICFVLNADGSISVDSIIKESNINGKITKKDYADKKEEIMQDYGRGFPSMVLREEIPITQ